jgi:drug/metabolite transporter (DMT)-like permease
MRIPNTVGWGLGLALATALISGFSVFLNGQFIKLFHDPTLLAAVRNGAVGLVLLAIAIANGGLREVARLGWRARLGLIAIGVVGGGISFALFFNGLAASSSPAAAIIHKTLFVWVAALAIPLLGERVGPLQVASLGLLLAGTVVLAPAGTIGAGVGELLVVAATLLWSLEVVVAKRLLRGGVPVSLVAASRMTIGAVALFSIVGATGDVSAVLAFTAQQWFAIAVTGTLLAGYVLTWFGALRRAPGDERHEHPRPGRRRHDHPSVLEHRRAAGPDGRARQRPPGHRRRGCRRGCVARRGRAPAAAAASASASAHDRDDRDRTHDHGGAGFGRTHVRPVRRPAQRPRLLRWQRFRQSAGSPPGRARRTRARESLQGVRGSLAVSHADRPVGRHRRPP